MTNFDLVQTVKEEARQSIPSVWEPFVFGALMELGFFLGDKIFPIGLTLGEMVISYFAYVFGSLYMRRMWVRSTK